MYRNCTVFTQALLLLKIIFDYGLFSNLITGARGQSHTCKEWLEMFSFRFLIHTQLLQNQKKKL